MNPRTAKVTALLLIGIAIAVLAGCTGTDGARAEPSPEPSAPAALASVQPAPTTPADAARGRELVATFQCNRCHEGTGLGAPEPHQACVGCHEDVLSGRRAVRGDMAERIRHELVSLRFAPSLTSAGAHLRPEWIAEYLLTPHDLRPALRATMPRLAVTPDQARDIAAYLSRDARSYPTVTLDPNDAAKGRALVAAKGCGTCHVLTGFDDGSNEPLPSASSPTDEAETRRVVVLAPDLRFIRERSTPAAIVAWLEDPTAIKADAAMPRVPLTHDEARAIAAFLTMAPLAPERVHTIPARLPLLDRRVTFEEIDRRVLRKSCRHCHGEPDDIHGDGGPGMSGGFGFAPRGLRFTSYEATSAGLLDAKGVRRSVFTPVADGTPRLVAALLARHAEEAGYPGPGGGVSPRDPEVRGMPLGLPPLSPEDIQLVESWVAQGRPR